MCIRDSANMVRWMQDPQAVKPGSYMPGFHLNNQQASDLAMFLEDLK